MVFEIGICESKMLKYDMSLRAIWNVMRFKHIKLPYVYQRQLYQN